MSPKPQAAGPWPLTTDHRSLITDRWPLATCRQLLLVLMVLFTASAGAQSARTNVVPEKQASPASSSPPGYAGSGSCRECHEKFYTLWSTSFHGLAMQPYTADLARTKLTPQTNEVVAGQYRFRADLQKSEVTERTATNETRYNALGQHDKAEASLRRALSLDPTNAPAQLNPGMLLAELGKMPEAEQAFRAAFKANPRSAQAAYNLGVLLSNDHPEDALDWCRRAATLGPDNPQYGCTYAFYLHRAGRLDQALQAIRSVRERHPAHEDGAKFEQALLREQKSAKQKQPSKN